MLTFEGRGIELCARFLKERGVLRRRECRESVHVPSAAEDLWQRVTACGGAVRGTSNHPSEADLCLCSSARQGVRAFECRVPTFHVKGGPNLRGQTRNREHGTRLRGEGRVVFTAARIVCLRVTFARGRRRQNSNLAALAPAPCHRVAATCM